MKKDEVGISNLQATILREWVFSSQTFLPYNLYTSISVCAETLGIEDGFLLSKHLGDPFVLHYKRGVSFSINDSYFEDLSKLPASESVLLSTDKLLQFHVNSELSLGSEAVGALDLMSVLSEKHLSFVKSEDKRFLSTIEKAIRKRNHDLRSPLFGISGFLQMAANEKKYSDEKDTFQLMLNSLQIIEDENKLLSALFTGKNVFADTSECNLSEYVEDILSEMNDLIEFRNINLSFLCDTPKIYVKIDKKKFKTALVELLHNSIESIVQGRTDNFMNTLSDDLSSDGDKIDIRVEQITVGASVTVSDTGVGIPSFVADRIFNPYFSYNRSSKLGVGLPVARLFLSTFNATLTNLKLPYGEGASFRIFMENL